MYTRICAMLSKVCLVLAIVGLIAIILSVQAQVYGRYLLNDTPTWAEALAMMLVLYVTAFGVAVGVRDAGHIGLDSFVSLLPEKLRLKIEILIHFLVGSFGACMAIYTFRMAKSNWGYRTDMLGVPEGMRHLPFVICGTLIVLFTIEHIIALIRGTEVEPAWH